MIWILLGILGVPIWLIVGVLIGIGLSRRKFKQQAGVFEIAIRPENATKWPRRPSYGRLVRDVLVVTRGIALLRTEVFAIDGVSPLELDEGPKKPDGAVGRLISFDDGSRREVALAGSNATKLDVAVSRNEAEHADQSSIKPDREKV